MQWHAETNDPAVDASKHFRVAWPEGVEVPSPPRFGPGARIRFKWDKGYLQGTILEVHRYFDILPDTVVYEVKEIGHHRTVYDKSGRGDITVIGGTHA